MNDPLIRTIRVNCPVDHAFKVFTEQIDLWWPPGHRRFEGSEILLEAQSGGQFIERKKDGEEIIHGEVIACDPPHRILYTWHPGSLAAPTEVEVRFTQQEESTLVEIIHSEGEDRTEGRWLERVQKFGRAWDEVLKAFGQQLEQATE